MNWKDVPVDFRDKLLGRKQAGVPVETLAHEIGMRPGTLDRRLREWAAKDMPDEKIKLRRPSMTMTDWTKPPVFSGDATITGDYHLPYADYELAAIMLATSKRILKPPRRLIIAGDLFNMDIFSRFPSLTSQKISLITELDLARKFLEDALGVFDHIEALLGNHERRFVYQLLGELGHNDLGKIVGVDNVTFHEYSHCVLDTSTGEWRVTHQANYSKNAQSVGVKLAHKFRQHVVTHHQHKMSKGYDDSGMSVVIDNGCMADPRFLDYANMVDTTNPRMTQGFTVIRNGSGLLFGKDKSFTDYTIFM